MTKVLNADSCVCHCWVGVFFLCFLFSLFSSGLNGQGLWGLPGLRSSRVSQLIFVGIRVPRSNLPHGLMESAGDVEVWPWGA